MWRLTSIPHSHSRPLSLLSLFSMTVGDVTMPSRKEFDSKDLIESMEMSGGWVSKSGRRSDRIEHQMNRFT